MTTREAALLLRVLPPGELLRLFPSGVVQRYYEDRCPRMKIWVSDYIDYPDQAGIDGFYASEEVAVRDIIERRYAPPYRVRWTQEREDGVLHLYGDFEGVRGYSTPHQGHWEIRPVEVTEK